MTKYTRVTGKVFGASADPTGTVDPTIGATIGQFGSALIGQYVGTSDIATIQSLPAWSNGFIGCVTPNTQFPPLPEMTGFGKVLSQQICYLLQQGIPEYDSGTTYYTGNWCSYNNSLYIAKDDGFSNITPTDTTKWDKFTGGFSRNYGEIVTSSLPITDPTLHLADGSLLQNTSYPEFVNYVANLYNSLPSGNFSTPVQETHLSSQSDWRSVVYGNNIWVAVSVGTSSSNKGKLSTSSDGETWTTPVDFSSSSNAYDLRAISFGKNKFVCITLGGNVFNSTDGTTWTGISPNPLGSHNWSSIAFGNNLFVAMSNNGYISTSLDGETWTTPAVPIGLSGTTYHWSSVCSNDNKFVALARGGAIAISYDAVNWTESAYNILPNTLTWNSIVYGLNEFIAISLEGYISTSKDGLTWTTPVSTLGSNDWIASFSGSNKIVALGKSGYISQKELPLVSIFTTEADWQATYITYGECGKYVYDSVNNTVRIPLYNSYFTNTVNTQKLGELTPASLPNIKGTVDNLVLQSSSATFDWTGAFYNAGIGGESVRPSNTTQVGTNEDNIGLDASRSSSIYSDTATTVNTQSIKQLVYIVVGK